MEVCDGERVYLIFKKNTHSQEEAIEEAKLRFGGDLEVCFAEKITDRQFLIGKNQGNYWCISKKGV